jgi:hypothetical protein
MVGLLGQNQLQNFFQNGLLGLGGPSAALGTQLPDNSMQQFYDPEAMKRYQLKRGLLGAGVGMLAQEPTIAPQNIGTQIGKGLGVGLLAADNAQQDYTQNALLASQMADQQSQREADMQQQQAMDSWLNTLPPDQRRLAEAFPQAVASQQAQAWYAPPSQGPQKPAAIQEYEYAKSQGFPGTFQDWEASKKGGMSMSFDPSTGQMTFQQGANIKPMTEAQSKDTIFATRAEGALKKLDPIANNLADPLSSVGASIPYVGNYLKGADYQNAEQAGLEFLQAILRKDTGAAITPAENDEYGKVYLPRAGDGPQVLQQKAESRQRVVAALNAGMTPQAILAKEKALQSQQPAADQPNSQPDTQQPQQAPIIATNPQTGQKLILQNGQWVPYNGQ